MTNKIFQRVLDFPEGTVIDTGAELGMLYGSALLPDGNLSVTIRFPRNLFHSTTPDTLIFTPDSAEQFQLDAWKIGSPQEFLSLVRIMDQKRNRDSE